MKITIFDLTAKDSKRVSNLLLSGGKKYSRYFTPFPYDADSLANVFNKAEKDCYWGIKCESTLAGLFMLRGFDEGFSRPSFGVYIAECFARKGLGKLALQYAICWCKLSGVSTLMLKVDPENTAARELYDGAGFKFEKICSRTGNHVLEKKLD